jgi:membrane complex biogenesis BtpA family protein
VSASPFKVLFPRHKPIIGVIHLPPLPGYPASPGLAATRDKALADLAALEAGGVDGVLVENEGDKPHRIEAGRETIALMTRITRDLVAAARRTVIGIEILLNDPTASLAVAVSSGARFIRTDYFVDRMVRPEYGGEMKIDPVGLMAYRRRLSAGDVLVLADIQVKYATMLDRRTIGESTRLAEQHGADAIVVTGMTTGDAPLKGDVKEAHETVENRPILVGSGLTAANAADLLAVADGAIVGTSLQTDASVDVEKVRALMTIVRHLAPTR